MHEYLVNLYFLSYLNIQFFTCTTRCLTLTQKSCQSVIRYYRYLPCSTYNIIYILLSSVFIVHQKCSFYKSHIQRSLLHFLKGGLMKGAYKLKYLVVLSCSEPSNFGNVVSFFGKQAKGSGHSGGMLLQKSFEMQHKSCNLSKCIISWTEKRGF